MTVHGDSGTPLSKKLGIAHGTRLTLVHQPDGFEELLAPLPEGVRVSRRLGLGQDIVIAFFTKRRRLETEFARLRTGIHDAGGLWIAWPKRASAVPSDVTEDVVRAVALSAGLVDNKVCSIDQTWSGLRVVVRRADRKPREPN